jgi:putative thioredoxin
MAASAIAKDIAAADFDREVIQESTRRPVVVDFWAPWCAPCRMLAPVLEREVERLAGRVALAKVNTDLEPALATKFGIQGIPAVKAWKDGRLSAEFVGAQPAAFVRTWLEDLAPSGAAQTLARAQAALRAGKPGEAEPLLLGLRDDAETKDQALLSLARIALASDRAALARDHLGRIDPRAPEADAVPGVERLLALVDEAAASGGESAARAALEKSPGDLAARHVIAGAAIARGDFAQALEQLLDSVGRDRKFRGDGARLAMLAIFDHLGNQDDLVHEYRRRLQILL